MRLESLCTSASSTHDTFKGAIGVFRLLLRTLEIVKYPEESSGGKIIPEERRSWKIASLLVSLSFSRLRSSTFHARLLIFGLAPLWVDIDGTLADGVCVLDSMSLCVMCKLQCDDANAMCAMATREVCYIANSLSSQCLMTIFSSSNIFFLQRTMMAAWV